MKSESIIFGVAGVCFGLIVGWVLASQPGTGRPVPAASAAASQPAPTPAPATDSQSGGPQARPLDTAQVQALTSEAARNPNDVNARVQLGNMYFDAEQYSDAVKWYQEALKLNPRDVNVSTDLGVSYYYLNEPDQALKQFDESLKIDPKHLKTLLNMGIVRAFGKQDLEGAAQVWQKLVDIAPDSPEGQAAKRALDSMKAAHPGMQPGSSPGA
ncbi:MAG: tetratricopeptide repeat protein [Acidobacteriota bacterium]|nr:tetratricopeptide repeat protein [Acidobacteriota bacterium]